MTVKEFFEFDFFSELFMVVGGIMMAFSLENWMSIYEITLRQKIIIFGGIGFLLAFSGYCFKKNDYFSGILFLMISSFFFILLILLFTSY